MRATPVNQKRFRIPFSQLAAIILATIAISFVVDFSRKAVESYRIHLRAKELTLMLEEAQLENQRLKAYKTYAETDSFVERAARQELKMGRPGEIRVVVVPPLPLETPELKPRPLATPPEGDEEKPYWHEWWELFFDTPPPVGF